METKSKKQVEKSGRENENRKQKRKSAFTLFREKYPNGVGEIIDMRAVLR